VEKTALKDARIVVTTSPRIKMASSISISVKPATGLWILGAGY
jgi:hypothetical protein